MWLLPCTNYQSCDFSHALTTSHVTSPHWYQGGIVVSQSLQKGLQCLNSRRFLSKEPSQFLEAGGRPCRVRWAEIALHLISSGSRSISLKQTYTHTNIECWGLVVKYIHRYVYMVTWGCSLPYPTTSATRIIIGKKCEDLDLHESTNTLT